MSGIVSESALYSSYLYSSARKTLAKGIGPGNRCLGSGGARKYVCVCGASLVHVMNGFEVMLLLLKSFLVLLGGMYGAMVG